MATPFFFVNKKGTSKKRPCQDYRYLNNWTIKNAHPLPLISDIMDKINPATFQHMMDNIFIVQTMKEWLIIYMDDMLILAETMEELTVRMLEVLQLLRENDLYLKPQKCEFGVTKVNFLGFIIEHGKMTMDPVKLAGIADWPVVFGGPVPGLEKDQGWTGL